MSLPPEAQAEFERQLTELARVVDAPLPPLAWGTDLSCLSDCTDSFAETPPDSPQIIAEGAARRLSTPRGSLPDDSDYGFDLRGYCNRGVAIGDLRTLQARVRNEVAKDARIANVDVQVIVNGSSLTVAAQITPANPNTAPFSFVVSVTSDTVLLTLIGA